MEHTPDGGPPGAEFILTSRDKVHPENWNEWRDKGFVWLNNHELKEGESAFNTNLKVFERTGHSLGVGKENVATGDPFDEETGRPVRRPGEYGIYIRPLEDQ